MIVRPKPEDYSEWDIRARADYSFLLEGNICGKYQDGECTRKSCCFFVARASPLLSITEVRMRAFMICAAGMDATVVGLIRHGMRQY